MTTTRPTITTRSIRLRDVRVGDVILFPPRDPTAPFPTSHWHEVKAVRSDEHSYGGEGISVYDHEDGYSLHNGRWSLTLSGYPDTLVTIQVEEGSLS